MHTEESIAAVVYRGDSIENTHIAHIAVVDAQGRLLCAFGDPLRITLARSAAKPAQALAIMETGSLEQFDLDDFDLAVICASHNSEPRHIQRVRGILEKSGTTEADLRCGGHPPISDEVFRSWIRSDFQPTPVCSNCSGKHAGMLAAAKALGETVENYHLQQHPLQAHVMRTVADVCELPDESIQWSTDGCNLPTPAFSLDRLGLLYAKIAAAADLDENKRSPRNLALAKIYHAMTTHPELVAGEGRFCTQLMQTFGGQLVGKVGADASYAIGLRGLQSKGALSEQQAIGIAIKVEDGNMAVLYAIVCEVLEQLQVGTADQREQLKAFHRPAMVNNMGVTTGRIEFEICLGGGILG
jgi:L-asparaginase II